MKKTIFIALAMILFVAFNAYAKFSRSEFRHWSDLDNDGFNTRTEVLIDSSITEVVIMNKSVLSGVWLCPYTGRLFTAPEDIDIDHIVPLAEAYRSGADKWDHKMKEQFANDYENLTISYDKTNQKKSDKDPAQWMPPNRAYWGPYINQWIYLKTKYKLEIDEAERRAIQFYLEESRKYEY